MILTKQNILTRFQDLISGLESRENISKWAYKIRQEEDVKNLNYVPKNKEDTLWGALLFLEGVDLKDSPTTYLHTIEDFKIFLDEFEKKIRL